MLLTTSGGTIAFMIIIPAMDIVIMVGMIIITAMSVRLVRFTVTLLLIAAADAAVMAMPIAVICVPAPAVQRRGIRKPAA